MDTSEYIVIDNGKIHYVIGSNKNDKIMVLLHGFGVDNHENGNFDKLSLELINNGYDYLRFDFYCYELNSVN